MRCCALLLLLTGAPRFEDDLADDDPEVRAGAEARIVRLGPEAAPGLRELRNHRDPEVAARASHILTRLAAPRIALGADPAGPFPKDRPLPATVLMANPWGAEVVFHPDSLHVAVEILELREQLRDDTEIAIFFPEARDQDCALSPSDFETAPAGGLFRHRISDLRSLLPAPLAGRYRLTVRYAFDPAAYRRRCRKGCAAHEALEAPWNRALTAPLSGSAEFTLR